MTDQSPTPRASAAPDWQNVAALAIAAFTAGAGLLAAHLGVAVADAHAFCDPIIVVCAMAYDARGAR